MSAEMLAKFKKSGLSLYDLPWFLVLGSKGAGKSTLLAHAGCVLSWEYQDDLSCRWLFSNKAVFIEVDLELENSAWVTLLAFLKKHRPKLPLNAILLVLALPLVISPQQIRECLARVVDGLGFVFPVVTVFTHLDSLVGFDAFFEHHEASLFQYESAAYDKLTTQVLPLLSSATSREKKFHILNFPDRFQACYTSIQAWLAELMNDNPYYEAPAFREMYFTSVSRFVPEVFVRLIQIGSTTTVKSRRQLGVARWFASLSLFSASVFIVMAFLIASASFARNTIRIQQGIHLGEQAENVSQQEDFLRLTRYLLSSPPRQLISPLQAILMKGVEQRVMPNRFDALENQLALMQERWALATSQEAQVMRGDYYNQLKLYLMFGHPRYRYAAFYADDPLVAFYLNHNHTPWPVRPDYIQLSRQQLGLPSNMDNIYAGFKAWGFKQLGKVSASDLFGVSLDKSVVLPKFFTPSAFAHYALPEITRLAEMNQRGNWVMNAPPESLKDTVLRMYKADYRQAWLIFLQTLRPAWGETVSEKTVHKIMVMAHQNILFKETDSDPMVKAAVQHIQQLPQLTHLMTESQLAWQSSVYDFYRTHLALKYPFYDSPDEVPVEDFEAFFSQPQGILWKYVNHYNHATISFSEQYHHRITQARALTSAFTFEIYPEPTLGLREIRLMTNHQTYRYRNDPQEWQSMHWALSDHADETSLEIITAHGKVGNIEFDSPWGLLRLFEKATLTRLSQGEFRAQWTIRADDGRHYRVDFLVKTFPNNNVLTLMLFDRFRLPENIVV